MNNAPLSTRKQIVTHLRRHGYLTVNKLAEKLDISPMGVRQHLNLLEKEGLVERQQIRQPIGRPTYTYSLTEKADNIFPKTYERFAKGLLDDIRCLDGDTKIALLFKRREERIAGNIKNRLTQSKLIDRARALEKFLNVYGHSAAVQKNKDGLSLIMFNCPIYQIAKDYPQLCESDKRLINNLLSVDARMLRSQAWGDRICEFAIK